MLGDSPAIGLLLYEHRFEFDWIQAPRITADAQYLQTHRNRPIRVYRRLVVCDSSEENSTSAVSIPVFWH